MSYKFMRSGRRRAAVAPALLLLLTPLLPPPPLLAAPPTKSRPEATQGGALPASLTWRRLLSAPDGATQRELSVPAQVA